MRDRYRYCLVQLSSPVTVGMTIARNPWPLHCTIAGVFNLEWDIATTDAFRTLVSSHDAFTVPTTTLDHFGPSGEFPVRRISRAGALVSLHADIVTFISTHGGTFKPPHFLNEKFQPHITMIGDTPGADEQVIFSELYLVDLFSGTSSTCTVIDVFALGRNSS